MKLTHHLLAHLVGWTLGVAVVAAALAVHDTRRTVEAEARSLLANASRVLDLQLARVALGTELDRRFPDWQLVDGLRLPAGACLRLLRRDGSIWRSSCRGADLARTQAAPGWFTHLQRRWPGDLQTLEAGLRSPVSAPARLQVVVEEREYAALAWRAARSTLLVVLTVAGALALVALVVVSLALRPVHAILGRIDDIERGELGRRLGTVRFTELQRIATALDRLAGSLGDALGQQRRLAAELISAQEDERRRLARELHDEFGQGLTGIAALTGAVRSDVAAGRLPPATELNRIAETAAAMQQQLRDMLGRLGPAALDDLGLAPALRSLVADWHARCRGRPAFGCELRSPLPARVAPALAITAYRIVQEALTNAARHAGATQVVLRIACTSLPQGAWLVLDVDDDGRGTDAPLVPGRGLTGMRERALALGGSVSWEARPGSGFSVRARLPLGRTDAA